LGIISSTGDVLSKVDPAGISDMATLGIGTVVNKADDVLLFGQKGVSKFFSKRGTLKGASIESVAEKLKTGALTADDVPINFVIIEGQRVAVNNRSFAALCKAGLKPTKLVDKTLDKKLVKEVQKRLSEIGGIPSRSIKIRDHENIIVNIIE
jgi:hypothetical protein